MDSGRVNFPVGSIDEIVDVDDERSGLHVPHVEADEPLHVDDDSVASNRGRVVEVDVIWVNGIKNWLPICPYEKKPHVGMSFEQLEQATSFYLDYANYCRFDVRLGGSRKSKSGMKILYRYMYCNKEGEPAHINYDSLTETSRKGASIKTGCKVMVYVKLDAWGRYRIGSFTEHHNHLLATVHQKQFLTSQRKMTDVHKHVVVSCLKINIGPVVAHKISKQLLGGFDKVGAQPTDFRNYHRDVVAYISDYDAQMIMDKLRKKKELYSRYYFEEKVVEGALCNIFWSDPTSQLNYHAYGDVLSFDATYGLNRYNMIFIPFTGIDNHKRSVMFAAALVSKEDILTYTWVVECFLKCMGRHPKVVITDQDPSLRQVIPKLMPQSHHRFCIWHIMKRLHEKVSFNTPPLQVFRSKLKSIVYDDHVSPEEFDVKWNALLLEYGMCNNKWLADMFKIRKFWIPAYFRDIPLGGLLRTTSRSESANSFFGRFLNCRLTLLAFFVGFDNALEFQRHAQAMCDYENRYNKSKMHTDLLIEIHALKVYTRTVFNDVQKEISAACFKLILVCLKVEDNVHTYQFQNGLNDTHIFEVSADIGQGLFTCSCKLFDRVGYLCSHVFAALKNLSIHAIPSRYILNRWCSDALKTVDVDKVLQNQVSAIEDDYLRESDSDLWFQFHTCLYLAGNDTGKKLFIESKLKEIHKELDVSGLATAGTSKFVSIGKMIGFDIPEEIAVKPPAIVFTKGSGKRKMSDRDESIKKSGRAERLCKRCNTRGYHDSRNCPLNESGVAAVSEVVREDFSD